MFIDWRAHGLDQKNLAAANALSNGNAHFAISEAAADYEETTLYLDPDSGLLTRLVRYGSSPIGRVLTQVDYADYRDVGGMKFPFELKVSWLDGRYTAKITDVKVNVPIDEATFGRPQ